MKVIDSRSFRPQPSTSQCNSASLPKDKLILNSETLLILNLLGMHSEVREQFLIDVAKQRKLLLTNAKTNTFNVNPVLFDVNNVPQVVDFVHQFHGKPIPCDVDSLTGVTRKLKQKVKKKEKEKKPVRTMVFENQKIVEAPELNAQSSKRSSSDRGSVSNVPANPFAKQQHQKSSNKVAASNEAAKTAHALTVSAQSASMNHLNKIIEKPTKKPRTVSACEQEISRALRQADAHRLSVDGEVSKRQQKRLRQKLRAMSLECAAQANAEKPPRKRGSRGSKKLADPSTSLPPQSGTTACMPKTDVAAKNLIRSKCSQINVKIQEKLNQCANANPGPSTCRTLSPYQIAASNDDLVVESIDRGDKSDDDDADSSSVMSDSSNFPYDEETTSYFAKSDEMESSCNEKRTAGSNVKASGPAKRNALKKDEDITAAVSSK